MRLAMTAGLLLSAAASAWAQQASQEDLQKKRDAKLAESWVKDGGWITDYDKAREEAKKAGKLVFAYFTVTYFH